MNMAGIRDLFSTGQFEFSRHALKRAHTVNSSIRPDRER